MSNLITRFRRILMGDESQLETGITPTGTIEITENGMHDVAEYAEAEVNVPASTVVSGTKNITTNGTHDVTRYASANVNVPMTLPNISEIANTITFINNTSKTISITDLKVERAKLSSTSPSLTYVVGSENVYVNSGSSTTRYYPYTVNNSYIPYKSAIGIIRSDSALPDINITCDDAKAFIRFVRCDERRYFFEVGRSELASNDYDDITFKINEVTSNT